MKTSRLKLLLVPVLLAASWLPAFGESVRITTTPEREAVVRASGSEVIVKIDIDARPPVIGSSLPLNLSLVLDRSGSMRGDKLQQAKQAVHAVLDRLTPADRISVVTYDSEIETIAAPAMATREHIETIRRRIDAVNARGTTALHGGVVEGARHVRSHMSEKTVNRVILMSDGLANVGPRTPQELAGLGADLGEKGIRVTTVGLGRDYNEDLMVGLADASLANYYYVADVEKLPAIFADELGRIRDIVARDLRIRIRTPRGVTPIEIIGHSHIEIHANEAVIPLAEIYGSQNRHFLVRCRIDSPARVLSKQNVLEVDTTYADAASGRSASAHTKQAVRLVAKEEESEQTVQPAVVESRVGAENVAARRTALALNDAGRHQEAAELLRQRAQYNAVAAEQHNLPQLKQEADRLESVAAPVAAGSLREYSPERKAFQYENWKEQNQVKKP